MNPPRAARALIGQLIFGVGARAYDVLTAQAVWRTQILRLLDQVPAPPGPVRVLDLGTGPGVSAFALATALPAGSRVTGVDLSPQMIARARDHHARRFPHLDGVDFVVADATALPFEAQSFDLVTGHSFLYLVPDPAAVLAEAARVARAGAHAVFMEPSRSGRLFAAAQTVPDPVAALRSDPLGIARFATSMALWRLVSATQTRMDPVRVRALFAASGWEPVAVRPTLGGLGLHGVGRRPTAA